MRCSFILPWILSCVTLFGLSRAFGQSKPPGPTHSAGPQAQQLPPGWEQIDQRLVFLTVQLSTVESSITATNKALIARGYQKQIRERDAEAASEKNHRMDSMGGGPIAWQDFYGRTAHAFFYHPVDGNTVYVNPDAVAQRPPQFDYIYRANQDSQQKAEDDAAKIGDKIDDLLAYRNQLEAEQSELWCKIVFRGVVSQGFPEQPLYRLDLAGPNGDAGRQSAQAASAAAEFLKSADAEMESALKSMDDQEEELGRVLSITSAARSRMQDQLLKLPAFATVTSEPKDPLGKLCLLAKRAEDSAQNLVDAWKLAHTADAKEDLAAKQRYRGQIQQSAIDYAQSIMNAHQALSAAVAVWKVTPIVNAAQSPAEKPAGANGDSVTQRLDAAKATYEREITAARRALAGEVDRRINDAAGAGDLAKVQQLQSAKVKAATDGTVDESITDPDILSAKKRMDQAIATSRGNLAAAYTSAIAELTRARNFTDATAVQEEFKASGLDQTAPSSSASTDTSSGTTPSAVDQPGAPAAADHAAFPGETLTVRLAGPADDLVLGGGGRYLLLHIKKLRKLAVFDVQAAKMAKYLDLPADDICFAAGRDFVVVGTRESGELQSYALRTLNKAAHSQGLGPNLKGIAMGYDSNGPLIVATANHTVIAEPSSFSRGKNLVWDPPWENSPPGAISVSGDGRTLVGYHFPGWAGVRCVTFQGTLPISRTSGGYINENDMLLPRDGSYIIDTLDGGKVFSADFKSQTNFESLPSCAYPTDDPAYLVAFKENRNHDGNTQPKLMVVGSADRHIILTLDDIPELEGAAPVAPFKRVTFLSRANLLLTLGEGGESLTLRKLDIYKSLADKDIDYLVVTSSPPASVSRGQSMHYQMSVKSRRGSVKYSVDSGPKGMSVSASGMVHWSVPKSLKEQSVSVIISVTDASGQQAFQSFSLGMNQTP